MQPVLQPGTYVFATVELLPPALAGHALMTFKEREGITIIVPVAIADDFHLSYNYVAAWITLQVHSALEAVGLTAAVAGALTGAGISCNVVAGFYHDHLFVAKEDGERAVKVLADLAERG